MTSWIKRTIRGSRRIFPTPENAAIAARRIVIARYAVPIHNLRLRFPPSEYTRNLLHCKARTHAEPRDSWWCGLPLARLHRSPSKRKQKRPSPEGLRPRVSTFPDSLRLVASRQAPSFL